MQMGGIEPTAAWTSESLCASPGACSTRDVAWKHFVAPEGSRNGSQESWWTKGTPERV